MASSQTNHLIPYEVCEDVDAGAHAHEGRAEPGVDLVERRAQHALGKVRLLV